MKHTYKNGNMIVTINDETGTRECFTRDDEFKPEFPLNIDVMISQKCNYGCPQCYAGCTSNGKHADLFGFEFINSLHPYTELALNINSEVPPRFEEFLQFIKEKKIITNVTVNQRFLEQHSDYIDKLYEDKLIYGLGVSLSNATPEFVQLIKKYPKAVIHTINGILTESDVEVLKDNDLKILILGYKMKNRGSEYYNSKDHKKIIDNQKWLYDNLEDIMGHFNVLSLDCLGIEQLEPKRFIPAEQYELLYQGRDGSITYAIDMVNGTFASSSTSEVEYPILDSVEEMFKVVLRESEEV